MKLGMQVGLGPGQIVLHGDPAPLPNGAQLLALNCRPMSVVAKWLDGSRYHLVWRQVSVQATLCYMETQLPSQIRGHSPQFSAHVFCGQTRL